MSTSANASQPPKVGETDHEEAPLPIGQPEPSDRADELDKVDPEPPVPVTSEVRDVALRQTTKTKASWWRRLKAAWGKLCDRRVTEPRKRCGRWVNGLLTIALGITAGVIGMTSINQAADASEPVSPYGLAFGITVATMAAVVGRGFASIYRTGWARLAAWLPVLVVVVGYSSIFLGIGNVPITSFLLILAGYLGPIVQDVIEVTGAEVESQDR